jgi:hypothetical protein
VDTHNCNVVLRDIVAIKNLEKTLQIVWHLGWGYSLYVFCTLYIYIYTHTNTHTHTHTHAYTQPNGVESVDNIGVAKNILSSFSLIFFQI